MKTLAIIKEELEYNGVESDAIATKLFRRLLEEGAVVQEPVPTYSTWRGAYCEFHNNHVLVWGAAGFFGSAISEVELWGLLREVKTADPGSLRRTAAMPKLPTDLVEREKALSKWLAENQVKMTAKDKRKRNQGINLDDLELDI